MLTLFYLLHTSVSVAHFLTFRHIVLVGSQELKLKRPKPSPLLHLCLSQLQHFHPQSLILTIIFHFLSLLYSEYQDYCRVLILPLFRNILKIHPPCPNSQNLYLCPSYLPFSLLESPLFWLETHIASTQPIQSATVQIYLPHPSRPHHSLFKTLHWLFQNHSNLNFSFLLSRSAQFHYGLISHLIPCFIPSRPYHSTNYTSLIHNFFPSPPPCFLDCHLHIYSLFNSIVLGLATPQFKSLLKTHFSETHKHEPR